MNTHLRMKIAASVIILFASLADILMTFALAPFYPGYIQITTPVSMLGSSASPVAGIASAWWILLGVLFMISGGLLIMPFLSLEKPWYLSVLPAVMLIIYGFGEGVASGLFRSEHAGDYSTFEATMHNIISGAGLISSILLPLTMIKVLKTKGLKIFSIMIFVTGILLFFLFQMRYIFPGNTLSTDYLGLWQRLLMLNFYLYLVVISVRILHSAFHI
ncbi:MAG: DUF998 domain-containing protein [Syntrophothermus sp.]